MIAAFFDVDGTLTKTNVLLPLIWFQRANLPKWRYILWKLRLMACVPLYLVADCIDRNLFVRLFYRTYKGLDANKVRHWHEENFAKTLQPLVLKDALAQVHQHQGQGHRIVLVTGGLDFVVTPLAQWLQADILATSLRERDGKFTGQLEKLPMVGVTKAEVMRSYAHQNSLDLKVSFAYADSISDKPMLECVGHPIAVNPDSSLLKLAQRNGWQIVEWR